MKLIKYLRGKLIVLTLASLIGSYGAISAQEFAHAGEYMGLIDQEYKAITADFWKYLNAVAHSRRARKVEKKRQELISTMSEVREKVKAMQPYEDDPSYRNSVVSFLDLNYLVLTEDYGKILDMEEIAEQSYDLMEAYLLAQSKAREKLDIAGDTLDGRRKSFAQRHQIQLIESNEVDETTQKVEAATKVMQYHDKIYLIFFKSYKQEIYFIEALNRGDINAMEQNKSTLEKYAEEGIEQLDTMKRFNNDVSLKMACRNMLSFYLEESQKKAPDLIDFYLKKENFEKLKESFDSKKQSELTQKDIDRYNEAVNKYNGAIKTYQKTNDYLNDHRSELIEDWNKTAQSFLDKHVPK